MEVKLMFPPLTYKQDALHVNWYVVIFSSSFKIKSLHKKCLSGQQLERDFRVYTIYRDKCIDLELKYSNSGYNLIDKNLPDLTLCGSPIIDGDNSEKYFVGVLRINTEGKAIPCFLSKGVLGE